MRIKPLHPEFKIPTRGTERSGGYDIYMPTPGVLLPEQAPVKYGLGFAAALPSSHVGLLLPRSGKGFNFGLDLNNTVGVIDADYRDEWFVKLRLKSGNTSPLTWKVGERLIQLLIVPVATVDFLVTDTLDLTTRTGGLGHTGD